MSNQNPFPNPFWGFKTSANFSYRQELILWRTVASMIKPKAIKLMQGIQYNLFFLKKIISSQWMNHRLWYALFCWPHMHQVKRKLVNKERKTKNIKDLAETGFEWINDMTNYIIIILIKPGLFLPADTSQ